MFSFMEKYCKGVKGVNDDGTVNQYLGRRRRMNINKDGEGVVNLKEFIVKKDTLKSSGAHLYWKRYEKYL